MISDILSNKSLQQIIRELFIRGRKLNMFFVSSYFTMKSSYKWDLQQVAFNHSSNIGFEGFINLYRKCTEKLYSFLKNDTTVESNDILERI